MGEYDDRIAGTKTISYTTTPNPTHLTTQWVRIGTFKLADAGEDSFQVKPSPKVTGIRIDTTDANDAIDELTVFANSAVTTGITIGNSPTKFQTVTDGWDSFSIVMKTDVFSADGTIGAWEAACGGANGQMALLILRPASGSDYKLIGADVRSVTVQSGGTKLSVSNFVASIGQNEVKAGDVMGLWFSGTRVWFDSSSPDQVAWSPSSGSLVGQASLVADKTYSYSGGSGQRTYYANAQLIKKV
jgi:hypothetical protein